MEEQVNPMDGPPPTSLRSNAGRFRSNDSRINKEGRPRGTRRVQADGPVELAPKTDRVMLLFLPGSDLIHRLGHQNAPWLTNLPADGQIVDSRLDKARNCLVLTIRSQAFPRIAKGTAIPELVPVWNGLRWSRH
jgi:hypothetical protein